LPRPRSGNERAGRGAAGGHAGDLVDDGGAKAEEDAPWPRGLRWHGGAASAGGGGAGAEPSRLRPSQGEEKTGPWREGGHGWTPVETNGGRGAVGRCARSVARREAVESVMSARPRRPGPRPRGVVAPRASQERRHISDDLPGLGSGWPFGVRRSLSCGSTNSVTARENRPPLVLPSSP
jgi:hypothetical protein